jgi:CheY-like chemotaxis protein
MILFVDDELRWVATYLEELQYSYEVYFEANVDDAFRSFEESKLEIDLLILDLMMDHGKLFGKEETELGLKTGILFYEKVRALAPELPIIILTNISDKKVAERFHREEKCWFMRKRDCLPHELPHVVRRVLGRSFVLNAMENTH